ncbi:MAG: hypothetical protein AAF436_05055 [Myxococcota bacterium]
MANTIFFAWQLDTPSSENKQPIWNAVCEAAASLESPGDPLLSPRPESDTQGASGTPNIVETIFRRIRECSLFVADVTFVTETAGGRKSPNPNVLLELGYAAHSIGWARTILVMNRAKGGPDQLPFDILQHRWPIEFRLTENTKARARRFESLRDALVAAFSECESHMLSRARDMARSIDTATLALVAEHENSELIPMPLPGKTMGEILVQTHRLPAYRHLLNIGAITVTNVPTIGYRWTADGRRMIAAIHELNPRLLQVAKNPPRRE